MLSTMRPPYRFLWRRPEPLAPAARSLELKSTTGYLSIFIVVRLCVFHDYCSEVCGQHVESGTQAGSRSWGSRLFRTCAEGYGFEASLS